jgi:hypothetical protein
MFFAFYCKTLTKHTTKNKNKNKKQKQKTAQKVKPPDTIQYIKI